MLLLLRQDTPFPLVNVLLQNSDGETKECQAPEGNGCCGCRRAIKRGLCDIPWEAACQACEQSDEFVASCRHMADIEAGRVTEYVDGRDTVSREDVTQDEVFAVYHGWPSNREGSFAEAHHGFTPSQVGIPTWPASHPLSGEKLQVHWK